MWEPTQSYTAVIDSFLANKRDIRPSEQCRTIILTQSLSASGGTLSSLVCCRALSLSTSAIFCSSRLTRTLVFF